MTRIETVPERLSSRGLDCGARFFVNDKNRIPHHGDAARCHTEQIRVIRGRQLRYKQQQAANDTN